jgi:hypothetical protein
MSITAWIGHRAGETTNPGRGDLQVPQRVDRDQQDEQEPGMSPRHRFVHVYLEQCRLEQMRDALQAELAKLQHSDRYLADELHNMRALLETIQWERARQARLSARHRTKAATLVAQPKALKDLPRHARRKSLDLLADEVLDAVHVVHHALERTLQQQVTPPTAVLQQIQRTVEALRKVFVTPGRNGLRKSQSVLTQLYFSEGRRKKRTRRKSTTRNGRH